MARMGSVSSSASVPGTSSHTGMARPQARKAPTKRAPSSRSDSRAACTRAKALKKTSSSSPRTQRTNSLPFMRHQ